MSFSSPVNRRIVSSPATYAFITHSPITLPNNLLADVDNEPLARRRRRRTSQHDQAILEEEFKINERPDKYARREIMKKVDLGEREIQIWFQNRRQTNRRRSKPLSLHELSTPISRSKLHMSSDYIASPDISFNSDIINHDERVNRMTISRPTSPIPCDLPRPSVQNRQSIVSILNEDEDERTHGSFLSSDAYKTDSSPAYPIALVKENRVEKMDRRTSPIHYLLNVDSEPSLPIIQPTNDVHESEGSQSTVPDTSFNSQTLDSSMTLDSSPMIIQNMDDRRTNGSGRAPRLLKRTSSMIRLSMSLEGKASVIMEDDESASVPLSLPSSQTSNDAKGSAPKRKVVDAKVWEVCCDSQSSVPIEKKTDDSPRKALKIIRARQVVAAAKEAALKRQKNTTNVSKAVKAKTTNPILAPKSPNKSAVKKKSPNRSSDKLKAQARNALLQTPTKKMPLLKSSITSSPPKMSNSPFKLFSEPASENSPTKILRARDMESNKENRDPNGSDAQTTNPNGKTQQRKVFGNLSSDVAEGEMECIENLLSLKGAPWTA